MSDFAKVHREHRDRLPMWTVYENLKDYPGKYVARLWLVEPKPEATNLAIIEDTLEGVRAKLPSGLYWLDRQKDDDPAIVEVWL